MTIWYNQRLWTTKTVSLIHTSRCLESLLVVSLFLDRHRLMSPYVNIPSKKSSSSTTSTHFCWLSCIQSIASFKVITSGTFTQFFDMAWETWQLVKLMMLVQKINSKQKKKKKTDNKLKEENCNEKQHWSNIKVKWWILISVKKGEIIQPLVLPEAYLH